MRLTRGERRALICYALVLLGFLPPVTLLVNRVHPRVFGIPFLVFWTGLMVLATSGLMTLALILVGREDGR